jgi:predicted transcriptional regulator
MEVSIMATAVLNVKIDDALKERLRHYAEVNNENLSVTTEKLLLLAFEAVAEAGVTEEDIDNQHTEEESTSPFTPKEIKALRKILKKKK